MSASSLDPRRFVIRDAWGRDLEYYMVDGRYWRHDWSPVSAAMEIEPIRPVSKQVYACLWLDLCLTEFEP